MGKRGKIRLLRVPAMNYSSPPSQHLHAEGCLNIKQTAGRGQGRGSPHAAFGARTRQRACGANEPLQCKYCIHPGAERARILHVYAKQTQIMPFLQAFHFTRHFFYISIGLHER